MPHHDTTIDRDTDTDTLPDIREPGRYAVLLYNDDFTPMQFVVEVLMDIFNHSYPDAVWLMLTVHKSGKAVAGTYSHEIAEQKVTETLDRASINQYPLLAVMEPA